MKKTVLSFFQTILLVIFVLSAGNVAAQTNLYTEGADLANSCCGSTFNISSAGTYTVSGTLTTVADGADWFQISVGAGLQLNNVQYSFTGPVSFDGGVNFAGLGSVAVLGTGSGSVSISPFSYPLSSGTYFTQVFANFSVGNGWTMTYTVTSTGCTAPAITTDPISTTKCSGTTATFTAAASGSPSPTVQWEVSTDGGSTWANLGGATSTTLSFSASIASNGFQYRAKFTNTCGTATSSAATLTVNSAPTITTQPTNQTTCAGTPVSFTATASGSPAPTVQWQKSTDGSVTWNNIGGATSTTLTFTPTSVDNGSTYRAIFTNTCGSVTSTAVALTVNSVTVTTQPNSVTVCAGTPVTFTAGSSGTPAATVQWQLSTDGGATFNNIGGATSTSLTFTSLASQSGNQYRAVFSNLCGSFNSNAATLTVNSIAIGTQPTDQTICSGNSATFTAITSGTPASTIQWQFSTDGGTTWNDLPGATSNPLIFPGSYGNNGWKFRAVFTNTCGSITSNSVVLNVNTAPTATNPAPQSACLGSTVTFSSTVSGIPAPTMQWQRSFDGGATWSDIAGATSATLSFTVTNAFRGTRYRFICTNSCGVFTTLSPALTVNDPPVVANDPADVTICSGNTATFTSIPQNGTTPTPTVQWQKSTDGGATWTDIGGANSNTYSFNASFGDNGSKFRAVFSNVCGSVASTAATLTVNTSAIVTTSPVSQVICSGNNVTFTAAATGIPTPTVQWQFTTDGITWNDIGGATSTTLSFTTSVANNDNLYRAVFTNSCGSTISLSASLLVNTASAVVANPTNVTTCAGSTVLFSASASGTPAPTVQWQKSTDGGATWNNIVGATSLTLSVTTAVSDNGSMYRAVFTNGCGVATTTAATLTVNTAVVITSNPLSQAICNGNPVTFSASATGSPAPTVKWQSSSDGGITWNDIGGATANTYTISSVGLSSNGWRFRAVYTNSCGSVNTTAAILTINTLPSVTTNPVSQVVCTGNTVTFTAAATGTPAAIVQWFQSTDAGVTWTSVPGGTSTTLSFVTNTTQNGYRYRATFTNTCGFATTAAAILTVNAAPVVTNQPVSQAICISSTVTFSAYASGTPTPTMQWQYSSDGGATWNSIGGANANTFSTVVSLANNGWQFRCLFTNTCGTTASNAAVLSVNILPAITSNPTTQSICNGTLVTFTASATGTPAPSVQWQRSVDNGLTWGNITGALSPSYTFAVSTLDNNNRYRAVFTNVCGSTVSAAAILTIKTAPLITTQPINTEVCAGANTFINLLATGTALTYQWQVNPGTGFVNATPGPLYSGTTTSSLSITAPSDNMSGYTYRCIVTGACAPPQTSNVVVLTVDTLPKVLTQTPSVTLCEGNNATFAITAKGTGLHYDWQFNSGSGWFYLKSNYPYMGVTTNTLTVMNVPANLSGILFRCIVRGTCSTTDSSVGDTMTVNTAPKIINQSSTNVTLCNTANDSFKVIATGTNLVYQWQLSTDGGSAWSSITNSPPYSGATTSTLTLTSVSMSMQQYKYRCIVSGTCPPRDTSDVITITLTNNSSWTGAVDNKWSNPLNWSCGVLPLATTNVFISQYVNNMPIVDIPGAVCDSITFGGDASLAFFGPSSRLDIKGSPICGLCKFDASNGTVIYSGTGPQLVQASTYKYLELNGTGKKTLVGGDATITNTITFTNGQLVMNDNNVVIDDNASIVGGSETSQFVTNGKGIVYVRNVGAGGKAGIQTVPLSDGGSYTPLSFSNSGNSQTYLIAVYNNVNSMYNKYFWPVGAPFTNFAVGKSWRLSTDTPGGSNVTLTLQWNAADELPDFNRNACYISSYLYPDWNAAPAILNSAGSGPYTLTTSGISNMTVFSVSSAVDGTTFRARKGTVEVYPNPASTTLNVKFNITPGRNVNIFILNVLGKEVYRVTENPYNYTDGIIPIDVSHLYPGEYMINVEDVDDNGEVRSTRFIKP